jgi:hypothetical protein
MKKMKFLGYGLFALVALINSCKKPTDGMNLIMNAEEVFKTSIAFQFVDAKTEEQIGFINSSEAVSVKVLGPDANKLINNAGSTKLNVDKGFMTIAVEKKYTPSSSNPIQFRVVAHAKGYLSTSVNISISSDGEYFEYVKMVRIDDTPKGVAAVVNNDVSTNSNSNTTSTVTISSPTMNTDYEQTKAEVTIPQGTKLRDKDGGFVLGNIQTTFAYFNNQDETSLEAFPGGFYGTTESGENVLFKTGGFVAMQMKNQNGKEVKTFGTPIQMRMEVPANTTNPDGELINEGMTIPVWSYDTETGLWNNEQEATITKNTTTDKFEVNFEMSHLSFFNLDWTFSDEELCTNHIQVTTENEYELFTFKFYTIINGVEEYVTKNSKSYRKSLNGPYQAFGLVISKTDNLKVKVYSESSSFCGAQELIKTININPCTPGQSIDITVNRPEVTINVEGTCSKDPGKIYKPNLNLYAKNESCLDEKWVLIGNMKNGTISSSKLADGAKYKFGTMIGTTWKVNKEVYTVQDNIKFDVVIPDDVCAKYK